MNQLEYSVVVPAFQAADVVGLCVRALSEQSMDRTRYEIIVVDDGSTDDTAGVAREAGADQVVCIPHGGPSVARNAGIEAARGEIVLFTDADCEPGPDWLARMTAPFTDAEVMGVKGTYRTRQTALMARLTQLEFEIRYERMATLSSIDFIDTYAAAYRRELLVRDGAFDPVFPPTSAEDVELSFRLARAGHKFVFAPTAWVWHRHSTSLWRYLERKARFGYWRALLYIRYPDKIAGDAHTDPALKVQFALVALAGLLAVVSLLWPPAVIPLLVVVALFGWTVLPFIRWAWGRDRLVAVVWPVITFLRVLVQGVGLALGFVWHTLT